MTTFSQKFWQYSAKTKWMNTFCQKFWRVLSFDLEFQPEINKWRRDNYDKLKQSYNFLMSKFISSHLSACLSAHLLARVPSLGSQMLIRSSFLRVENHLTSRPRLSGKKFFVMIACSKCLLCRHDDGDWHFQRHLVLFKISDTILTCYFPRMIRNVLSDQ